MDANAYAAMEIQNIRSEETTNMTVIHTAQAKTEKMHDTMHISNTWKRRCGEIKMGLCGCT